MRKEIFYAGLSFGFNASACIVSSKNGVVAAISQERVCGEKNTKEIPIDALLACCKKANVCEIERIAYSHYQKLTIEEIRKYASDKYKGVANDAKNVNDFFERVLLNGGIKVKESTLYRVNHHTAHAYSGVGIYGMENDFVSISSDGFGDGISARILVKKGEETEVLSEVKLENSVALVYQFVTGALGFKMHQHEGKITGLAAFGAPVYVENFEELFHKVCYGNGLSLKLDEADSLSSEQKEMVANSNIHFFDRFLMLKQMVFDLVKRLKAKGAEEKDIAASLQKFTEDTNEKWIDANLTEWLEHHNLKGQICCFLSGGLFANVKLNQRVKDMNLFKEVLVAPPMGDEGTALGSAIFLALKENNYSFHSYDKSSLRRVCSGTEIIKDGDMKKIDEFVKANNDKVSAKLVDSNSELIKDIAEYLKEKKIVCLCKGEMEFGPRALCNRSILYDCTDKTVNDWLNRQLGRTEFMPFAPVCLESDADDLFYNLDGGRESAKFMTMTFDCKKEFVKGYPAACHVDKTARPQLVSKDTDYLMNGILEKYKELTSKKVLINTSFNLHNCPIVEDVENAMKSWLTSNTDVLVLENIILERIDDYGNKS